MIKEFIFTSADDNSKKNDDVYLQCKDLIASKKDFVVKFENFKVSKSYQQLKGIHKLCQIYCEYMQEALGEKVPFECAKESLKYTIDYTRLATYDEAISETLKLKRQKKILGVKMTIAEFNSIVRALQLNLKVPRSFAEATLEEMQELIEKVHELGREMKWHNLQLTNYEMQEMVNYYEQKND
jgi:hypothetical protein